MIRNRLLLACLLTLVVLSSALAAESRPVVVADVRSLDALEQVICVSLQAVANRSKAGSRVFLTTRGYDEEWLDIALSLQPAEVAHLSSDELLDLLRPTLEGQVLYDPEAPFTLDLATTAAALRNAVISHRDLGLPTLYDFRGRWSSAARGYQWALETLLPQCSTTQVALLPPESVSFRDFAIQRRMFTLSPPKWPDDDVFQSVLFRLPPGAMVFGACEPEIRAELSNSSHAFVQAGETPNLSFLSAIEPARKLHQYLGYLQATEPRYLTLIFDCSGLDFALNEMPQLWGNPLRGTIPLGWALPGALAEAAPPAVHRYYADAYWSGLDQFVLGPSGVGEIDLARASAPYGFFQRTAEAAARLDITAGVYATAADPEQLGEEVSRYAAETGLAGLFIMGAEDFEPMVYGGVPAIAAPRVTTVEDAVAYLDRLPLERRCAALALDPGHLGLSDAALIAAHVSSRYVILPPAEMIDVVRDTSLPYREGPASIAIAATDYGEPGDPSGPIPVTAAIDPLGNVFSASVVYCPEGSALAFSEPMRETAGGSFRASVPPLLEGGPLELRVRARDGAGGETWSPMWSLTIPRSDQDGDGLSDAEEAYLLTDPESPDTDGDGLRDAADVAPRDFGRSEIVYAGPVEPPDDAPYLQESGGRADAAVGRVLQPGEHCTYRLPLAGTAPGTPMAVALTAWGAASVSTGRSPEHMTGAFEGELEGTWYAEATVAEPADQAMFVRVSCPASAPGPLTLSTLALVSPPAGPSIAGVQRVPAHPGPEQPIEVSAVVFSPAGIADVRLTFRVNRRGSITVPMKPGELQRYRARIPSFENRDELEYWVEAVDSGGRRTISRPEFALVGGRGREIAALVTTRDFIGAWRFGGGYNGSARRAPDAGARDLAYVNLTGGTYSVWVLGSGAGQSFEVRVRSQVVGKVDPDRPDGWQRIGRVRLEAGRHPVEVISLEAPGGLEGAEPHYAGVVFSEDASFEPPENRVFDTYDTINLLYPPAGETLSGWVELRATAAGNITGAEFSLDGDVLKRVSGPPFRASVNASRLPAGSHLLRVEGVYRGNATGLAVAVPVMVAE